MIGWVGKKHNNTSTRTLASKSSVPPACTYTAAGRSYTGTAMYVSENLERLRDVCVGGQL